jgi:hypothetical protein
MCRRKTTFQPLPHGFDFGIVGAGIEKKDLLMRMGKVGSGFKMAEFAAHEKLLLSMAEVRLGRGDY